MRFKKITALFLSGLMTIGLMAGCSSGSGGEQASTPAPSTADAGQSAAAPAGDSSLKGKRVRVVIGSTSTGGDSYMMADIVTRHLSAQLGFNGKVDAVGNAAALDAVSKAKGDGTTIMMFHDMTFLSVLFGAVGEEYALENLTVGPRIGQNPGACFAANGAAPYDSLKGAADWLKQNPDKTLSVNIESGASSHLAFAVYWLWVDETYGSDVSGRIKAIVGGTTDEKKQRLWDGNCDVIFGDYSSFVEYSKEGVDAQLSMKIMDPTDKIEGVDIATMAEDGISFGGSPFVFSKDFAMYFPKDMDAAVLAEIEAAMQKVCADPGFISELAALKYKALTPDETAVEASNTFLYDKRETSKKIIEAAPSLDTLT